MAEIVDLNRARKDRKRTERTAKAEQNRAAFGRTNTEKALVRSKEDAARRLLDAHRRDPGET